MPTVHPGQTHVPHSRAHATHAHHIARRTVTPPPPRAIPEVSWLSRTLSVLVECRWARTGIGVDCRTWHTWVPCRTRARISGFAKTLSMPLAPCYNSASKHPQPSRALFLRLYAHTRPALAPASPRACAAETAPHARCTSGAMRRSRCPGREPADRRAPTDVTMLQVPHV
jgi:hypothetical protein